MKNLLATFSLAYFLVTFAPTLGFFAAMACAALYLFVPALAPLLRRSETHRSDS